MADIHVSKAGSNTAPYDTWAKAATSWASAIAGSAAGDRFLCGAAGAHNIDASSASLYAFPGTPANPNEVISGTPAATSGLFATGSGALISATGVNDITVTGSVRWDNMRISNTAAAGTVNIGGSGDVMEFNSCLFISAIALVFGAPSATVASKMRVTSPVILFTQPGGYIGLNGDVSIYNGGVDSGSAIPGAPLFRSSARTAIAEISGFDLTRLSTGLDAVSCAYGGNRIIFRDCTMPSGWTGMPCSSSPLGNQVEMWNCTDGNTNYTMHLQDSGRRLVSNTSTYRTGGATDGTTPLAWSLITTAASGKANVSRSAPILALNTTTGAAINVTVEVAHSLAAALTDANCWLEVEYLGSASTNRGSLASTQTRYPVAASALPASTAAWSGAPAFLQKLSLSFAPQKAGFLIARVCTNLASGSTITIDPVLTIS